MGNAASLFFNTANDVQTLHRRIKPSDEQYSDQQEDWNDLRDFLVERLKEHYELPVSSWLQGSYKFGTQVRPSQKGREFDIDLGIYVEWAGAPDDGYVAPLSLKEKVQELLLEYSDDDENDAGKVSDPKPRCNRIHFDDDFHIDTPCYHLDRDRDIRHLATQNDEWEHSDPKALYLWWRDEISEDIRPRARRLVQYVKMWAELTFDQGGKPSSILLTVLFAEAIQAIDFEGLSGDDEWFSSIVSFVTERLRDSFHVSNPVDVGENLNRLSNDECLDFLEKIGELETVCFRAMAASTVGQAAEIWSEAFQHFMPIPDDDSVIKEAAGALVPLTFDPLVSIVAAPKASPMLVHKGTNKIGPIPRDCEITFTLMNADRLPAGSVVKWMVRNEGAEAEEQNDLGHVAGVGLSAEEHSEYQGTHYMDVTVTLNGRMIGRRRVPVIISGNAVRRPKKGRPSGIGNRRRR